MKKIAILGAHSVGKTELCNRLVAYCEANNLSVQQVDDVSRECCLTLGEHQTIAETLWLCCRQIQREIEAEIDQPAYVICDRCVLDPIVYLLAYKPDDVYPEVVEFFEHYSKGYDKMVLVRPANTPIRPDEFRKTDRELQYMIDNIFINWIVGRCMILDSETIACLETDQLCVQILGG
jgi:nicotinamide riboside kinase